MTIELSYTLASYWGSSADFETVDGKLDYKKLAEDTGAKNGSVAWKRWDRYKKKLFSAAASGKPATPRSVGQTLPKTPKNSTTPKTPMTPKSKGEFKLKGGRASNKRKAEDIEIDDVEEENESVKSGDDEEVWEGVIETPTRRMPARKKRAADFKELSSEEDADEEEVEEEAEEEAEVEVKGEQDVKVKPEKDAVAEEGDNFFDCEDEA